VQFNIVFNKDDVKEAQRAILESVANRILDNAIMETEHQRIEIGQGDGDYIKGWAKKVGTEHYIKNPSKYKAVAKEWVESGGESNLIAQLSEFDTERLYAEVGNFAPHAALIEWGTEPYSANRTKSGKRFFPNVDALKKWAMQVKMEDEATATKSAWAMATYFSKHGFKPHYVLTKAVTKAVAQMSGE
jgi:hypothetical protein